MMTQADTPLLLALFYLLTKHYVADFLLQTPYQLSNKGRYAHPGGLLHVLIHALLTLPVIFIVPQAGLSLLMLLVCCEALFHYHLDWGKDRVLAATGWSVDSEHYWHLFGLDQLLHMLSYLLIAWLLAASV